MNYPSYGTDNIGIIGQGFVGTALREGLKNTFTIETYDRFVKEKSTCEKHTRTEQITIVEKMSLLSIVVHVLKPIVVSVSSITVSIQ